MKQFRTFREEFFRVQAVRIAHISRPNGMSWGESNDDRERYRQFLNGNTWRIVNPFCLLKASIVRLYFLSPVDFGRWGGFNRPSGINDFTRSTLIPAELILTACNDDEADNALREILDKPPSRTALDQVEVISWFGYTRHSPLEPQDETPVDNHAWGPFCRLAEKIDEFHQLALIFFQCRRVDVLKSLHGVFNGLDKFQTPRTTWTPLICGLLKGNIDAFVILGRSDAGEPITRQMELADELSEFIGNADLHKNYPFWASIIPNYLYLAQNEGGGRDDDGGERANIELLRLLETPIRARTERTA